MVALSIFAVPGLLRRFACLSYELLLMAALVITLAAFYTAFKAWLGDTYWLEFVFRLSIVSVLFFYFCVSWTTKGQTVAMTAWRIKVVQADGGTLNWQRAGLRFFSALILCTMLPLLAYLGIRRHYGPSPLAVWLSFIWAFLPFLAACVDPERQFLHDRLAGTRLIHIPSRRN